MAMLATIWEAFSRNWALLSIGITLVMLVIIPVLILNRYIRIMLNIIKDTPPPLAMGVPYDKRLALRGRRV